MYKRAIVTGGGHGIGEEIVAALVERDYEVGVLDVDTEAAARVAGRYDLAVPLSADVGNYAEVASAFDQFGGLDLLINNAGIVRFGGLLDQSAEEMCDVIRINLLGSVFCAQQAARKMAEQGSGVVINMSSINAAHPAPNVGLYAAAKAAIASMTQLQAIEWGPLGIRVNAIAPGFIDAGMSAPIFQNEAIRAKRSSGVPLRRLGSAEDVINAILFLASSEAEYVHGHELVVDGGVINSVLAHLPRD